MTTTAAVTSGVPAALHLVAELAGPAEAQRVANLPPRARLDPDRDDRPSPKTTSLSTTGPSGSTT